MSELSQHIVSASVLRAYEEAMFVAAGCSPADGSQAVQQALEHDYDLILMDMQMPIMNGDEATMELRKKGITTPIVALTANAMDGDDKKCIEAGCDYYLPKPIIREDLMDVLKKYLCPAGTCEETG